MPTWIGFLGKKKETPLIVSTSGYFSKKSISPLVKKKNRRFN